MEIKKHYIFDVDGTLTPSRQKINDDFAVFFCNFCSNNNVYLVTGSDKSKTLEQVGEEIYSLAKRVYNCSGNDVWQSKKHIRTNEWTLPESAHEWLSEQLSASAFPLRCGIHFEHRPGMVNFSIVGRGAGTFSRREYVAWDTEHDERVYIAHNFNLLFPDLEARPGGETGIDIAPKGLDKSQIVKDFDPKDELHFFGDRMDPAGNDYPLKKVIIDNDLGFCYNVRNWEETWNILKNV